jgi:hypothetical protein
MLLHDRLKGMEHIMFAEYKCLGVPDKAKYGNCQCSYGGMDSGEERQPLPTGVHMHRTTDHGRWAGAEILDPVTSALADHSK